MLRRQNTLPGIAGHPARIAGNSRSTGEERSENIFNKRIFHGKSKPGPGNFFGYPHHGAHASGDAARGTRPPGDAPLLDLPAPSARGRPSGPEPRTIFRPAGWTPAAPSKQPDRNAIKSCKSLRGRPLEPGAARRVAANRKQGPCRQSGIARPSLRRNRRSGTGAPVRRVSRFGKPECKSSENSRTGSSNRQNRNGVPARRGAALCARKEGAARTGPLCQGLYDAGGQTHVRTRSGGRAAAQERGGDAPHGRTRPRRDPLRTDEPEPGPVAGEARSGPSREKRSRQNQPGTQRREHSPHPGRTAGRRRARRRYAGRPLDALRCRAGRTLRTARMARRDARSRNQTSSRSRPQLQPRPAR